MKTPGIEAGTGSLGQGLSRRWNGIRPKLIDDSKVYILCGDGEMGEGQFEKLQWLQSMDWIIL